MVGENVVMVLNFEENTLKHTDIGSDLRRSGSLSFQKMVRRSFSGKAKLGETEANIFTAQKGIVALRSATAFQMQNEKRN
jgi:hypothetical protein